MHSIPVARDQLMNSTPPTRARIVSTLAGRLTGTERLAINFASLARYPKLMAVVSDLTPPVTSVESCRDDIDGDRSGEIEYRNASPETEAGLHTLRVDGGRRGRIGVGTGGRVRGG